MSQTEQPEYEKLKDILIEIWTDALITQGIDNNEANNTSKLYFENAERAVAEKNIIVLFPLNGEQMLEAEKEGKHSNQRIPHFACPSCRFHPGFQTAGSCADCQKGATDLPDFR